MIEIYNKCYKDGYFPDELKVAKVIPLYKNKGNIEDIGNYRPISMLSVFSKLFEKLIHKRMTDYLTENEIINNSQYGFRAAHSTLHALVNATENLYKSLDKNLHTLGIFIDFSKAFDTINHDILCSKLENYGIHGNMLKLIKNYLSNRTQYVNYGGNNSSQLPILHGIPQGSVLGPLRFILFLNDIVNLSGLAQFVLFADDANIFVSHINRSSLYQLSNTILSEIYNYCCANKLIINFDKCCFIEFKCKDSSPEYSLNVLNHKIEEVDKCKFLGVHINSDLDWSDHMMHVKKQVSRSIGALYSVKSSIPQKNLRSIYFALVQPYLIYNLPLWGSNHTSKYFNDLFILQKKAIRIITNKTTKIGNKFQNTKQLFKKTHILTLHNMYFYFTASEGRRIIDAGKPARIYDYFDISPRSHLLLLPKYKKEKLKSSSFIFNASKIINYFSTNHISYRDISQSKFKILLKRHLMALQSKSLNSDPNWLPSNFSIFSDVQL